ncbi:Rpn family recombination-promoting nuclease/putative transposase [Candidatus Wolbachia massiliensis]|uniref:Rpn family recombination-promoting nuclease/putative transposase n=1 Tax=Candidatus Wolbachia massiliensis TaxID=1845000 RepID=A0A7L7YMW0_9RICK|nr:Rpn family recombination-promoting nuclease/putative transposase [Candidatus Wolbachia massiliensis]QOD38388.1 Rpn family recombination-promoting nuclease/putative transposase [Candidatus Wolbachia massiliensis]
MAFSKFLDPKNDIALRHIFDTEKNKDILIHFLNDILGFAGKDEIKEIEFLSTIMDAEIASKEQSIIDVLCQDSIGNRFVVEMQLICDKGFKKRAQYYAAKAYSRQFDRYANLQKIFFIAISNCVLFPNKSNYISSHTIRDDETNEHNLQDFQFVFIELPKFPKNKVEQLTSTVERWCFFFKYAEETTDEDLKKIAEEAPIIKRAYDELDKFHWNERDLTAYEERIMDLYKEEAILEQKLDEGREEGKIEVAKAMLADNVDVKTIVKFTGLSISEIERIAKLKDTH